jgi:hypothetical protein
MRRIASSVWNFMRRWYRADANQRRQYLQVRARVFPIAAAVFLGGAIILFLLGDAQGALLITGFLIINALVVYLVSKHW